MAVASLQDDDASEQASQPSLIRILVGDELGQLRGTLQKEHESSKRQHSVPLL